jgi:REP element-mobilizing transposase RayT
MARRLRLHVPGGFYHVTLRGNHQQPIFFAATDRDLLNRIVAEAIAELRARIHAFCWMTNHVHLLVQVSDEPLGRLMHRIASKYARTVQARIATTGHLFERRYHAALVDTDRYLIAVLRYIHLNPVGPATASIFARRTAPG